MRRLFAPMLNPLLLTVLAAWAAASIATVYLALGLIAFWWWPLLRAWARGWRPLLRWLGSLFPAPPPPMLARPAPEPFDMAEIPIIPDRTIDAAWSRYSSSPSADSWRYLAAHVEWAFQDERARLARTEIARLKGRQPSTRRVREEIARLEEVVAAHERNFLPLLEPPLVTPLIEVDPGLLDRDGFRWCLVPKRLRWGSAEEFERAAARVIR